MTDIARTTGEQSVEFALKERFVEIDRDGKLCARWRKKISPTQIRHPKPPGASKPKSRTKARREPRVRACGPRLKLQRGEGYPKPDPPGGLGPRRRGFHSKINPLSQFIPLFFTPDNALSMSSNRPAPADSAVPQEPPASAASGSLPVPASFEHAVAELESLVSRMEDGALSLEDSLAAYQRGTFLVGFCRQSLATVSRRVKVLEGDLLKPFEDDTGDAS